MYFPFLLSRAIWFSSFSVKARQTGRVIFAFIVLVRIVMPKHVKKLYSLNSLSCLFIISGASVSRSAVGSDTNRYGAGSECDERRPQRDRVQLASPVTPQNSHWQCSYTQILRESVRVRSKRVRCRHKRWLVKGAITKFQNRCIAPSLSLAY